MKEIDEEENKSLKYDILIDKLQRYFSSDPIDMSKLDEMLTIYNKNFYLINKSYLYKSGDEERIERFAEIGGLIANVLNIQGENNQPIGKTMIENCIEYDEKLVKQPALIQYFASAFCKDLGLPFTPIRSFCFFGKGALCENETNMIFIQSSLGAKIADMTDKNAYCLFAIAHEYGHLKQRFSNPNGTKEEQMNYLFSNLQPLEDGYEKGSPSHHITKHEQFPDEAKANFDACSGLKDYIGRTFDIDEEKKEQIFSFYDDKSKEYLIKYSPEDRQFETPEEYLDFFVKNNLQQNQNLSETEQSRVDIFIEKYEQILELPLEQN